MTPDRTPEPARNAGATAAAVVTAVIVLVEAFGLGLTDAQADAVIGLVAVVAPLVAAWYTRRRVTPVV